MTYFTLSSPFVHYLLPDSSVCFILKTGGAENSVHACRRRCAPSRTDQNARKNGIFVHCPYINKGVVHFSRLVVLLWCLSTGETKTPWKKRSAVPDDFQLSSKHMDNSSIHNFYRVCCPWFLRIFQGKSATRSVLFHTQTHHRNRMITTWKDDVWKRRNKLNLREETSIKWGLGFSRGVKERCNCLCPSTPRVSPHILCDTLYNSVQGIFLPWTYHSS